VVEAGTVVVMGAVVIVVLSVMIVVAAGYVGRRRHPRSQTAPQMTASTSTIIAISPTCSKNCPPHRRQLSSVSIA
jgi:hypothetical protein